MGDDKSAIGAAAILRIDLAHEDAVRAWCQLFECTEASLRAAIRIVGNDAAAVREWLASGRKPSDKALPTRMDSTYH